MRTPGLLHRFFSLICRTVRTPSVINPEMFIGWRREPDFIIIQRCADYAYQYRIPVRASGTYYLDRSVSLRGLSWEGGIFVGDTPIYIDDTSLENTEINGSHVEIQGGRCTVRNNIFYNQTATAALLIKGLTSEARLDCSYNEFYNCNYAILQQGTGDFQMASAIYSYNSIHDIRGDGIELNVVNRHYYDGLIIEGNIICNVNGSNTSWGIGIGVAGLAPYGTDTPDENYVANFSIRGNRILGCRQCIHTELCRDFSIINNDCSPDTSKSTTSGLRFAAYVAYGCKRFVVDGLSGEPVGAANRYVQIDWGSNDGVWAGPPVDFTLRNVNTTQGDIEIATGCADSWTNTTIVENIRCRAMKWRGLPSTSKFSDMFCSSIDCIGRYSASEGGGGGLLSRSFYTYTHWTNIICIDEVNASVAFSKMYVDRIRQEGNNFYIPISEAITGHRGPKLITTMEEYKLYDDKFPPGREFSDGCVLWKASGGYYLVTVAGALINSGGTRPDIIKATTAGQAYIQSNDLNWQSDQVKAAGTRIVIPGAGDTGNDLITTITCGVYISNGVYTVNIDPPIVTPTVDNVVIRAAYPVSYIDVTATVNEMVSAPSIR